MSLIDLKNIRLSYGGPILLDGVNLVIEPQERVCLLGRNGEGKSSLMHIINGTVSPDSGEIKQKQNLKIGLLDQEVPGGIPGTVFDLVAGGMQGLGDLVAEYFRISSTLHQKNDASLTQRLGEIQQRLEIEGGWQLEQKIQSVITRIDLAAEAPFATLSAGLKRRTLLARALVGQPDILLLDEPTNHLDIASISWMEDFLSDFEGSILFVTHDRSFLKRLATRIVELDRGRLTSRTGSYETYLKHKSAELEAEKSQQANFDKKLAREESWIRQGIKARRTRNEGRVRKLTEMRQQRNQRRLQQATVLMDIEDAGHSGKIVCKTVKASFAYSDKSIIKDLSTTIVRGDRVGIIGPNGSGKTTLLQLLLNIINPLSGSVNQGTNLKTAYFDQLRDQLDDDKSVFDNVAGGNDTVTLAGGTRHVYSYLQDFLFAPERARSPVKSLSGGERNRLLLAKLFTQPSNLLVMDEPTNDLDIETLELLEDLLLQYNGTILLVSHDRTFINNVVTSTLVFEGAGRVVEYIGGYDDWVRQSPTNAQPAPSAQAAPKQKRRKPAGKRKLSYKEERELETLPEQIEQLEEEQQELYGRLADPAFYRQESEAVAQAKERCETIEQELPRLYTRWEELDEITK
ncbi:MAG: ATP-binding cassette domain-containing protein [Deltaproteobacteria bacterium]|nr:ATP-binding cassette domain-containing protein [Deltaproteobacteria bacterium]